MRCGIVFFLLAAAAGAQGLTNPGFENGLDGWQVTSAGAKAEVREENAHEGKRCLRVERGSAPTGVVMQAIDSKAFRGRRVVLRGAVRVDGASFRDGAHLWCRVDRENGRPGFLERLQVRAAAWQAYEIRADVAPDAVRIAFGLVVRGGAVAWLDDVSLAVGIELEPVKLLPPRPLEGRALLNLVVFTRALGYVRHFHPTAEAVGTDWSRFARRGVLAVEDAKDADELAQRLGKLFGRIAPAVKFGADVSRPTRRPPGETVSWRHKGFGQATSGIYWSKRVPSESHPEHVVELAPGISCRVPLWAAPSKAKADEDPTSSAQLSGNDRATRLAAVALCWNVFQHFYPYFDVVAVDWNEELQKALTRAAADKDGRAFLDTLRLMVAALQDGHGGVYHASDRNFFVLPLLWDWVEETLVVTHSDAEAVKRGEIVVRIDGVAAADALREAARFISGSPQWRRWRALNQIAAGAQGSKAELVLRNAKGEERKVTLTRSARMRTVREPRPEPIAEIRPGIWYIDGERATEANYRAVAGKIAEARGLVLEFRGYPSSLRIPWLVFPHLHDEELQSARWNVPMVERPDGERWSWNTDGRWRIPAQKPRWKAKMAFVTDGRAISYAESCLGIVEHYELGAIVGQPTAGANGNVNPFGLPGGYRVTWTGMKVIKHDKSQHHLVGIRPTHPVRRTLAGVRAGKDELLEKAIEIVSSPER